MRPLLSLLCGLLLLTQVLLADGPADNIIDNVRQIPPLGIEIPESDRTTLRQGLDQLTTAIDALRQDKNPSTQVLLPDVEVFHRAIQQTLDFGEIYSEGEIKQAHEVLAEGLRRAEQLKAHQPAWVTQKGLVVRGYRSRLDGTVQPYGLVIPQSYTFDGAHRYRCDLWFHGRGEKSLETQFISQRMRSVGQIEPADTIVLHPFGRYSNAFKFAGEIDVLEALEHAQQHYRINDERIAVRGFSMGGAGVWHFAVHYPDRFFAATPGAGFSETPEFLKSFQGETLNPPWYEERLWNLYDCPSWVMNLRLVPTIAYSGEIDRQKQAADIMAVACSQVGMNLQHIIGPETAHKIHPDSLVEIERKLLELQQAPRRRWVIDNSAMQATTWTLRYNSFGPITILGLDEHWQKSRAMILPNGNLDGKAYLVGLSIDGVNDLAVSFPAGQLKHHPVQGPSLVRVQNQLVIVPTPPTDGSWDFRIYRDGETWKSGIPPDDDQLRKRPGLQGPIDDAFMDSFLYVLPSGTAAHPQVEAWTESELEHAQIHWRQQMRGDVRYVNDTDLTDEQIAQHNLILWGDAQSNSIIARVLPQLPIVWDNETIQVDEQKFDATTHAPVLIYPNPLNPKKYIVLNSGFTYREYDYLNNARQTPKLPDWAIIDLSVPPNSRWPGKVAAANFFDERWQLKTSKE
ncbi:MAG: prolyl oligopeptidase family serine peptidase [Planctomycetaceae bacterium]|nr:prolyl oligopeptidase family serine peptidase [Planctomycetaceae bacterium]